MTTQPYPTQVCSECGVSANVLTCLKKYGRRPNQLQYSATTYHLGTCDVCGEEKAVARPRYFYHPDFGLLTPPTVSLEEYKKSVAICPQCNDFLEQFNLNKDGLILGDQMGYHCSGCDIIYRLEPLEEAV